MVEEILMKSNKPPICRLLIFSACLLGSSALGAYIGALSVENMRVKVKQERKSQVERVLE